MARLKDSKREYHLLWINEDGEVNFLSSVFTDNPQEALFNYIIFKATGFIDIPENLIKKGNSIREYYFAKMDKGSYMIMEMQYHHKLQKYNQH